MAIETTQNKNLLCLYEMLLKIKEQMINWDIYDKYKEDFVKYSFLLTNAIYNSLNLLTKNTEKRNTRSYNVWFRYC